MKSKNCIKTTKLSYFMTVLLSVFMMQFGFAQESKTVSGTITSAEDGFGVPGATVQVQGTKSSTITDFDGKYKIEAKTGDVLVFTFVGFKTQNIKVGDQKIVNAVLQPETAELKEVVVIGYGSQKKTLVTNAVTQVSGENLTKTNTTNALQALQGQAAGLQITSTSGQPGESLNVVIRGVGSTAGSNPLYVVDGVLTGDISYLNNSDIESISVLKDAASAAIYGSQASNGVVLVTTKKGKRGATGQITFDQYYGVQSVARKVDLLDAREYATILNEARVNSGNTPYFTNAQIAGMGSGTNWMDKMLTDNAATKNFSFGASGGSETSVYSASLSYLGQEGVVGGPDLSNYERYNFRFNSEHKLYKDVVTIGENLSFAYIDRNGIGVGNQYNNSLRGAFQATPLLPMYDANGNYFDTSGSTEPWLTGVANPYALMVYNNQNESNSQKLLGNVYLQIQPVKNLTFRTTLGLDYNVSEGHSYSPIYRLSIYANNAFDRVNQNMNKSRSINWDNLLTYKFNVADNHHFEAMAGTSYINYNTTSIEAANADSVFNDLEHAWIDNTTNKDGARMSMKGSKFENVLMSYFGRLNYNYQEKYLLNATLRADGSSKFAQGNQWGYFPSVSGGWVASNEEFLKDSKVFNFLKFRASWGQVGNQSIRSFQFLSLIKSNNTNYSFGDKEGVLTPGAYPQNIANPDLKWETSEQIDLGFDARFLDNALSVNFDVYKKTNKDWLILAPILATAGADAPFINGGDVVNKGVELSLNYQNKIGDFNYSVSANGAYNKNTVGSIPNADGIIHGLNGELYDNSGEFYRAENGYPLGYFWGYKTGGVFQNQAQIDNYKSANGVVLQPNAAPGDLIYVNTNGDDKIDASDKTSIGNPNPDFTYGFSLSASYKAFDFSLNANGVAGNQIVQSYRNQANTYGNYTSAILSRWHGEGSSNTMPRVTEDNRNFTQFSDLYVQDGDFLRINTVTLGFDLAKMKHSKPFFASQFRMYFSVLNLYTFTKYDGMDPEIGFGSSNDDQKFSSGVDVGYYPRPRTFMLGLNVKL
ncbi:SusC/RagA family TonB-linked outer membrane protein [Flavobacterium quisquiliarum]|uniref:SusC/RagA family TonB-linked outer membrane protein n=1 Tax=Flavobacterium quisquiliarum TaxID=1834436 RepID=A0ABV8WB27_9FLAO|nr:TonB-dependent receptor [Flavobacterium quisquiliarum]MBW1658317.1 SusC/RagA family TonB-linked outer membrane protein [Flavobacterium quisquiliarum]NWL02154.1 SusC/RagA family TonB-linked outer membrane protein [Flavobacterium collinsii]